MPATTKLTPDQKEFILTNPLGLKQREMAERFNLSAATINRVIRGTMAHAIKIESEFFNMDEMAKYYRY